MNEKPEKSGLSTQSLAHNSISLQILPCRKRACPYRQPLTGPNAPVGKCLCKGLSPVPALPTPEATEECRLSTSARHRREAPFNKSSFTDSIIASPRPEASL